MFKLRGVIRRGGGGETAVIEAEFQSALTNYFLHDDCLKFRFNAEAQRGRGARRIMETW
jgi:hypothetical protein